MLCSKQNIQFESPWIDEGNKYYAYDKGFPKDITWYSFFQMTPIAKHDNERIWRCYVEKFLGKVLKSVQDQLRARMKSDTSDEIKIHASDLLCLIDGKGKLHLCEWEHFATLFTNAKQLFNNDVFKVRVAYLISSCTINKRSGDMLGLTKLCPNPCLMDSLCAHQHTKSSRCELADETFLLHSDNYKCDCKDLYEWDQKQLKCVVKNVCYLNEYCGGFMRSTHCEIMQRSFDEIAYGHYEYKIKCRCAKEFMGDRCELKRDACKENYYSSHPAGDRACGNGECLSVLGTNRYTCNCEDGWENADELAYPNCKKLIDSCALIKCTDKGYCKLSGDKKKAECICQAGYEGVHCEKTIGLWLQWSRWSSCNPSCGHSRKRNRTRVCSDPVHLNKCYRQGDLADLEIGTCDAKPCAVFGKYNKWSEWSRCGTNCTMYMYRARECVYNEDIFDNQRVKVKCIGLDQEVRPCPTFLTCDFFFMKIVIVIIVSIIFYGAIYGLLKYRVKKIDDLMRRFIKKVNKLIKHVQKTSSTQKDDDVSQKKKVVKINLDF